MSEREKREYSGTALSAFVLGLAHSQSILHETLADGIEHLAEHGAGGCRPTGAPTCIDHSTW